MIDYFNLLKTHPKLFSNKGALFEIITDRKTIANWQEQERLRLKNDHEPEEWADIGVLLDDPYNVLVRDLVKFQDGHLGGYIRSFSAKGLQKGTGVVVLPEYDGKFLLLHQYRHATRQWHYEIPRGYAESKTSAEENAIREIEEEINGVVKELIYLGDFHNNTGYEVFPVSLFMAKILSVGQPDKNEGIEEILSLSLEELEEWIDNNKITDGFTIAAYAFAKIKGLV